MRDPLAGIRLKDEEPEQAGSPLDAIDLFGDAGTQEKVEPKSPLDSIDLFGNRGGAVHPSPAVPATGSPLALDAAQGVAGTLDNMPGVSGVQEKVQELRKDLGDQGAAKRLEQYAKVAPKAQEGVDEYLDRGFKEELWDGTKREVANVPTVMALGATKGAIGLARAGMWAAEHAPFLQQAIGQGGVGGKSLQQYLDGADDTLGEWQKAASDAIADVPMNSFGRLYFEQAGDLVTAMPAVGAAGKVGKAVVSGLRPAASRAMSKVAPQAVQALSKGLGTKAAGYAIAGIENGMGMAVYSGVRAASEGAPWQEVVSAVRDGLLMGMTGDASMAIPNKFWSTLFEGGLQGATAAVVQTLATGKIPDIDDANVWSQVFQGIAMRGTQARGEWKDASRKANLSKRVNAEIDIAEAARKAAGLDLEAVQKQAEAELAAEARVAVREVEQPTVIIAKESVQDAPVLPDVAKDVPVEAPAKDRAVEAQPMRPEDDIFAGIRLFPDDPVPEAPVAQAKVAEVVKDDYVPWPEEPSGYEHLAPEDAGEPDLGAPDYRSPVDGVDYGSVLDTGESNYLNKTVEDLRAIATKRGLRSSGTKDDVRLRLEAADGGDWSGVEKKPPVYDQDALRKRQYLEALFKRGIKKPEKGVGAGLEDLAGADFSDVPKKAFKKGKDVLAWDQVLMQVVEDGWLQEGATWDDFRRLAREAQQPLVDLSDDPASLHARFLGSLDMAEPRPIPQGSLGNGDLVRLKGKWYQAATDQTSGKRFLIGDGGSRREMPPGVMATDHVGRDTLDYSWAMEHWRSTGKGPMPPKSGAPVSQEKTIAVGPDGLIDLQFDRGPEPEGRAKGRQQEVGRFWNNSGRAATTKHGVAPEAHNTGAHDLIERTIEIVMRDPNQIEQYANTFAAAPPADFIGVALSFRVSDYLYSRNPNDPRIARIDRQVGRGAVHAGRYIDAFKYVKDAASQSPSAAIMSFERQLMENNKLRAPEQLVAMERAAERIMEAAEYGVFSQKTLLYTIHDMIARAFGHTQKIAEARQGKLDLAAAYRAKNEVQKYISGEAALPSPGGVEWIEPPPLGIKWTPEQEKSVWSLWTKFRTNEMRGQEFLFPTPHDRALEYTAENKPHEWPDDMRQKGLFPPSEPSKRASHPLDGKDARGLEMTPERMQRWWDTLASWIEKDNGHPLPDLYLVPRKISEREYAKGTGSVDALLREAKYSSQKEAKSLRDMDAELTFAMARGLKKAREDVAIGPVHPSVDKAIREATVMFADGGKSAQDIAEYLQASLPDDMPEAYRGKLREKISEAVEKWTAGRRDSLTSAIQKSRVPLKGDLRKHLDDWVRYGVIDDVALQDALGGALGMARLTDAERKMIADLTVKASGLQGEARADLLAARDAMVSAKMKLSLGEYLRAYQTCSMLLNTTTAMVNLTGNYVGSKMLHASDHVAGPVIDKILSKVLGTKERTLAAPAASVRAGERKSWFKTLARDAGHAWKHQDTMPYDFEAWAGSQIEQIKADGLLEHVNGAKWEGLDSQVRSVATAALGVIMRSTDRANFWNMLKRHMSAQAEAITLQYGEHAPDVIRERLGAIKAEATLEALQSTYQDPNKISNLGVDIQRGLSKIGIESFGLDRFTLPMVKTVGGIGTRILEFAGLGFARGLVRTGVLASKIHTMDKLGVRDQQWIWRQQQKAVKDLSRGLVGASLGMAGMFLAKSGLLVPDAGSAEEKEFNRAKGIVDMSLNLSALGRWVLSGDRRALAWKNGDQLRTLASIQPLSAILGMYAAIPSHEEMNQAAVGAKGGVLDGVLNYMFRISEFIPALDQQLADQPLLNLVRNVAQYTKRQEKFSPLGILQHSILSGLTTMAPSIFRRIRLMQDPYLRDTFSGRAADSAFFKLLNDLEDRLPSVAMLPGGKFLPHSTRLPKRYDSLGNPMTTRDPGAGLWGKLFGCLDIMLSPSIGRTYRSTKGTDLLTQLYNESGNTLILPPNNRNVHNIQETHGEWTEKIELEPGEKELFQREVGQRYGQALDRLADIVEARNLKLAELPPDKRSDMVMETAKMLREARSKIVRDVKDMIVSSIGKDELRRRLMVKRSGSKQWMPYQAARQ